MVGLGVGEDDGIDVGGSVGAGVGLRVGGEDGGTVITGAEVGPIVGTDE